MKATIFRDAFESLFEVSHSILIILINAHEVLGDDEPWEVDSRLMAFQPAAMSTMIGQASRLKHVPLSAAKVQR